MSIAQFVDTSSAKSVRKSIFMFFFLSVLVASNGGDFVLLQRVFEPRDDGADKVVLNATLRAWLFFIQLFLLVKTFTTWYSELGDYRKSGADEEEPRYTAAKDDLKKFERLVSELREFDLADPVRPLDLKKEDLQNLDRKMTDLLKKTFEKGPDDIGRMQVDTESQGRFYDALHKATGRVGSDFRALFDDLFEDLAAVSQKRDNIVKFHNLHFLQYSELGDALRSRVRSIHKTRLVRRTELILLDLFVPTCLCIFGMLVCLYPAVIQWELWSWFRSWFV